MIREGKELTIIFDMDGVVFDTERLYYECYISAAEQLGLADIEEVINKCFGMTVEETDKMLIAHYGDCIPLEEFDRLSYEFYRKRCDEYGVPLKKGVVELLTFLKECGVRVALASSTEMGIVERQLRSAGLLDYFDVIVSGDMVDNSKPSPDIFLLTAQKLQTDIADCIVVEDSFNGVRAAHAAGATVFMVPDLLQPTEEIQALTDKVFASLIEVQEYLLLNE
ncbi:MAG: HAD family phosphatase [Firmicutes bacterium]|nr:HAD family phosphatase [Bacillota bacterium]